MRQYFRREGNKLAFNSMDAEPIFDIIQEMEHGYMYFMSNKPFGELMFVHKDLVKEPDEDSAPTQAAPPEEE